MTFIPIATLFQQEYTIITDAIHSLYNIQVRIPKDKCKRSSSRASLQKTAEYQPGVSSALHFFPSSAASKLAVSPADPFPSLLQNHLSEQMHTSAHLCFLSLTAV